MFFIRFISFALAFVAVVAAPTPKDNLAIREEERTGMYV